MNSPIASCYSSVASNTFREVFNACRGLLSHIDSSVMNSPTEDTCLPESIYVSLCVFTRRVSITYVAILYT